jgi:16S rRNA (cytidine1402-2'-O)-methyltransferase
MTASAFKLKHLNNNMENNFGKLFIVATPIGNLEDITYRAVRVLGEVGYVFAEDTRTTGILLKKFNIPNADPRGYSRLRSYNAVNQHTKNSEIIKLLEEGKNIALVTDAGTPGISDPGYGAVHEARKLGASVIPIPGASALTAFLSVLGTGTHAWTFYGFLPHKNGRQKLLKEMLASDKSSIFYESTHRIEKCMEEICLLKKNTKVVLGRELTKIYEEILTGTGEEILEIFKKNPEKKKGEFVVMIV